jgi:hypothetical protein
MTRSQWVRIARSLASAEFGILRNENLQINDNGRYRLSDKAGRGWHSSVVEHIEKKRYFQVVIRRRNWLGKNEK